MAVKATPRQTRSQASAPSGGLSPLALAAVPVLTAVVVYLPALRNGFLWDDPLVLQQLRAIHSWTDLIFLPPLIPKFYYRPVIFLSYLIDRGLGGETPFWFHASVIAMHAVNTALVFVLARRLFADATIAAISALLFAVYPTHVESVAWMAGRSDVIVCTFMIVSVLLMQQRQVAWSAWLGGIAYLLALFSKETALAILILVPSVDWLQTRRFHPLRYATLLLGTALYFLLRQANIGAVVGGAAVAQPLPDVGLDVVRALGFYALQSAVPFVLSGYVPQVPQGFVFVLAGLVLLIAGALGVFLAWQRKQQLVGWLVVWFFLTLAPSLVVILRRSASALVADRYLYVPSVATCILAAYALMRIARARRAAATAPLLIAGALSLAFAVRTITYIPVWFDNLSFWSDVVSKDDRDALAQREVGIALLERGRTAEAETALHKALALPADAESRVMALSNLGNVYRRSGRVDDAIKSFDEALRIGPHPGLYHNLGLSLMSKIEQEQRAGDQDGVRRDIVRARDAFRSALSFEGKPGAEVLLQQWSPAKSHALLGQVLFSMGDLAGARQHLEAALQLEPTGPIADATRQYMARLPK